MTNERKDEAPAASAEEWPKRAPPTIDLDASEVSGDTRAARGLNAARAFMRNAADRASALRAPSGDMLSKIVAPLSGAVAALLVLAGVWAAGLIGQPPLQPAPPQVSSSQFDNVAANIGDLTARVARAEAALARPPTSTSASDPALVARIDALEKSVAALRDEASRLAGQLRSVTASLNDIKAASPAGAASPPPELGPLNDRLTRLEAALRSLAAEAAKPAAAAAPTMDDVNVRRLVLANTLDVAVRRGEPYAAALAAAKQVAPDPAALSPLDAFSARGIPSETALLREIVGVLERLAATDGAKAAPAKRADQPAAEASQGTALERLQSGLSKLVRIERSDAPAAKSAAPQPATAPAMRHDSLAAARQDIGKLPVASNSQVQTWMAAVDAREKALAATQKFSAEALAAFGKSGQ